MRLSTIGWLLLALGVVSPAAQAGAIRGQLRLPAKPRGSAGPGHEAAARPAPVPAPASDAVIFVERIPGKGLKKLAPRAGRFKVVQAHHTFVPRVLAIVAGSRVTFQNADLVYHNIFSVSPARRFDLGKYAPRERREVGFDSTGVVNLYCDIHPDMAGFIVVVPNRAHTRPAPSGAFALPALPRGSYLVKAWHPAFGQISRAVEVPRRGDVRLDLSF